MSKSKCSGNVADDFRNMARQLEHFNRQFPAEYKINFYLKQAKQQLKLAKDENRKQDMRSMIRAGNTALEALGTNDIDGLLEAYERIHRIKDKYNLPYYKAEGVSAKQSNIAKNPRRPGLPKRAVKLAISRGHRTVTAIENFLNNAGDLSDDWGDLGIDPEMDGFIVTDFTHKKKGRPDECPTKLLTKERITKLISEIK